MCISALAFGAWISQDLVRKANRNQSIPHYMHGDPDLGYEVVPTNIAYTAEMLKLAYDEWDYSEPSPQAAAWKKWTKGHLVKGQPVVMMPLCQGDSHSCYPFSCPNGGHMDHVEPIFGIFSNHSFDDPDVYDDDVILHASDQDLQTYYRPMSTLEDSVEMDNNCAAAQAGFGLNEMYPCIDESVTYSLAVMGFAVNDEDSSLVPVALTVNVPNASEPDVRRGEEPVQLFGVVTVGPGLVQGARYSLYRFSGTDSLPQSPPFDVGYEHVFSFEYDTEDDEAADPGFFVYEDPNPFFSDTAVYYLAVWISEPTNE
uniref:Uncharacterized protein n=1 Tax=Octactis speculum TaxID=3111310 RepID=A0A7S2F8Z7_9STRA|mmetsp:Transcript_17631/g.23783  ORF Transcript_17631/g.23783 Transcript_17631/m.23783 type:complete len:313 (+) Transcript_17631:42-980(+)